MGDLRVIGLLFNAKDNRSKDNENFGVCRHQNEIELGVKWEFDNDVEELGCLPGQIQMQLKKRSISSHFENIK